MGEGQFDILRVRNQQTDKEFDLYFNVDIPMGWLEKQTMSNKK